MSGGIDTPEGQEFSVQAVPNPFTNTLSIEYNLTDDQDVTISIFNSIGQQLLEIPNISGHTGINYFSLDANRYNLADLPRGMYMIRLDCREASRIIKLVKL
jgi:hypothetical protein